MSEFYYCPQCRMRIDHYIPRGKDIFSCAYCGTDQPLSKALTPTSAAPQKIYMLIDPETNPEYGELLSDLDDIRFYETRQYPQDVEYIRADLIKELL